MIVSSLTVVPEPGIRSPSLSRSPIVQSSTILPLIVNYFGGSSMLVGFFAALLRGGAIVVQLFAAFQAQSYKLMLPYIRRVFIIRFLAWFFIGVAIIVFGEDSPNLTLFSIGLGLFIFSFSAGFGAIYFKDIIVKQVDQNLIKPCRFQ